MRRTPFRPTRLVATALGVLAAVSGAAGATLAAAPTASAANHAPLVGNDVSWPNCPKGMGIPSRRSEGQPMPSSTVGFAVIGLTNGPGFSVNPCLRSQVAWAKSHHRKAGMYAMTTFPTRTQLSRYGGSGPYPGRDQASRIRNAVWTEAKLNVTNARAAGLTNRFIWIDVEDYRWAPWTSNVSWNRAAVEGAVRAYHEAGISVGVYSVAGMWNRLTGSWRNGMPVWDTVAGAGQRTATGRCSAPSFTGGTRLLTQWWTPHQDFDVTCPGVTGQTASPSPLAAYRGTTLRVGSRGFAVAAVQQRVGARADGAFGPQTRARVAAFQRSHHLRPTGVVASAEWRALGAWSTVPASTGRMASLFVQY
jgi:hypothetical protein